MTTPPPWRPSPTSTIAATPTTAFNGNLNRKPAFTSAPVRKSFREVPPPPPTQFQTPPPEQQNAGESSPGGKTQFPEALRQYVARSFEGIFNKEDKAAVEAKLRDVITDAFEHKVQNEIDWDNFPSPMDMLRKDNESAFRRDEASAFPRQDYSNSYQTHSRTDLDPSPPNPKKRKLLESPYSRADDGVDPPWRKPNSRNVFEDRITQVSYADKADKRTRNRKEEMNGQGMSKFDKKLEKRQRRFEDRNKDSFSPNPRYSRQTSPTPDPHQGPVVGLSMEHFKKYFRLTSAPDPHNVRPQSILEETLKLLKDKWRQEKNYTYICDQFKSMRQDLTVQHIKNEFTVKVYETHARIALEKGDLGEYNQCQTQLRTLYSQKMGGHPLEFKAYRILYLIYTCNRTDMNDVLADLTTAEKKDPAVRHALDVRSALALGNYHKFFKLFVESPNMGAYLMDVFIARERLSALSSICKSYKPDTSIRFITEELGFESDQECAQFVVNQEAQHLLYESEDSVRLLTGKAGTLFESAKRASFSRVDIKGQI